eukprot:TRINITY_DN5145_c0_g3_i1.p1 TRINITY_DN5145_c0_g3~~TRINITY_DN5145_c0_g3_i1.p1  ORF type:complete len:2469 (+),score=889.42 TRINITY_DN5145_c0_g3_i1:971-7408(+)
MAEKKRDHQRSEKPVRPVGEGELRAFDLGLVCKVGALEDTPPLVVDSSDSETESDDSCSSAGDPGAAAAAGSLEQTAHQHLEDIVRKMLIDYVANGSDVRRFDLELKVKIEQYESLIKRALSKPDRARAKRDRDEKKRGSSPALDSALASSIGSLTSSESPPPPPPLPSQFTYNTSYLLARALSGHHIPNLRHQDIAIVECVRAHTERDPHVLVAAVLRHPLLADTLARNKVVLAAKRFEDELLSRFQPAFDLGKACAWIQSEFDVTEEGALEGVRMLCRKRLVIPCPAEGLDHGRVDMRTSCKLIQLELALRGEHNFRSSSTTLSGSEGGGALPTHDEYLEMLSHHRETYPSSISIPTWTKVICRLAWKAATTLFPRGCEDILMDARECIDVVCIPGGSPFDSEYVCGAVIRRNVASRTMPTDIERPRLLLVGDQIDYESTAVVSDFGALVPGTQEGSGGSGTGSEVSWLEQLSNRVTTMRPDVVLVERSVHMKIQENLAKAGIALATNVSAEALQRVRRTTQAVVCEQLARIPPRFLGAVAEDDPAVELFEGCPKLGRSECFAVRRVGGRPLMYICGGRRDKGCAVVLRGASPSVLEQLERVLKFAAFAAHNLVLETNYLKDAGGMFAAANDSPRTEAQSDDDSSHGNPDEASTGPVCVSRNPSLERAGCRGNTQLLSTSMCVDIGVPSLTTDAFKKGDLPPGHLLAPRPPGERQVREQRDFIKEIAEWRRNQVTRGDSSTTTLIRHDVETPTGAPTDADEPDDDDDDDEGLLTLDRQPSPEPGDLVARERGHASPGRLWAKSMPSLKYDPEADRHRPVREESGSSTPLASSPPPSSRLHGVLSPTKTQGSRESARRHIHTRTISSFSEVSESMSSPTNAGFAIRPRGQAVIDVDDSLDSWQCREQAAYLRSVLDAARWEPMVDGKKVQTEAARKKETAIQALTEMGYMNPSHPHHQAIRVHQTITRTAAPAPADGEAGSAESSSLRTSLEGASKVHRHSLQHSLSLSRDFDLEQFSRDEEGAGMASVSDAKLDPKMHDSKLRFAGGTSAEFRTLLIEYYKIKKDRGSDIPLGLYLADHATDVITAQGNVAITRQYSHNEGRIAVSAERVAEDFGQAVRMWTVCKKCGETSRKVKCSARTLNYSFGKFLESSFYNFTAVTRTCRHSLHGDTKRCFGQTRLLEDGRSVSVVVTFDYHPVKVYTVAFPKTECQYDAGKFQAFVAGEVEELDRAIREGYSAVRRAARDLQHFHEELWVENAAEEGEAFQRRVHEEQLRLHAQVAAQVQATDLTAATAMEMNKLLKVLHAGLQGWATELSVRWQNTPNLEELRRVEKMARGSKTGFAGLVRKRFNKNDEAKPKGGAADVKEPSSVHADQGGEAVEKLYHALTNLYNARAKEKPDAHLRTPPQSRRSSPFPGASAALTPNASPSTSPGPFQPLPFPAGEVDNAPAVHLSPPRAREPRVGLPHVPPAIPFLHDACAPGAAGAAAPPETSETTLNSTSTSAHDGDAQLTAAAAADGKGGAVHSPLPPPAQAVGTSPVEYMPQQLPVSPVGSPSHRLSWHSPRESMDFSASAPSILQAAHDRGGPLTHTLSIGSAALRGEMKARGERVPPINLPKLSQGKVNTKDPPQVKLPASLGGNGVLLNLAQGTGGGDDPLKVIVRLDEPTSIIAYTLCSEQYRRHTLTPPSSPTKPTHRPHRAHSPHDPNAPQASPVAGGTPILSARAPETVVSETSMLPDAADDAVSTPMMLNLTSLQSQASDQDSAAGSNSPAPSRRPTVMGKPPHPSGGAPRPTPSAQGQGQGRAKMDMNRLLSVLGETKRRVEIKEFEVHQGVDSASGRASQQQQLRFACSVLCARQFHAIRQCYCNGDESTFIASLSRCVPFAPTGGKTGANYYKTRDERFVLKAIKQEEMQHFEEKLSKRYFDYVAATFRGERRSVLVKIMGVFKVAKREGSSLQNTNWLLMENMFYNRHVDRMYDLKGSTRNRFQGNVDAVLLDENLLLQIKGGDWIFTDEHGKEILHRAVHNDTLMLGQSSIMDYSMLLGVNDAKRELYIGIIDYMREYDMIKRFEWAFKSSGIVGGRGQQPTIVEPKIYKERFRTQMDNYFLMIPNKGTPWVINHNRYEPAAKSQRYEVDQQGGHVA